eukprot:CAMPEP_0118851366 /NCGR_PEP_ID=MMETSP1163-20130328/841_1 /TAXON_ID=124430 /ORGANISM="Phaeomonas parva, Strain CCMP2877" /LENGTH=271 /DNA_ID=CAMNT_0006783705 /DNA_START=140 /DNA_END=955 /DNA_ORIENTATION=-
MRAAATVLLIATALPAASGWRTMRTRPTTRLASTKESMADAPKSFVQGDLRAAAMKLHTREQAPKEGEAEAPKRRPKRDPTVLDYAQFLLDSKVAYAEFERIVNTQECLKDFRNTGLERVAALEKDLATLAADFDDDVAGLEAGKFGPEYAKKLADLDADMSASDNAAESEALGRFMCHFYNHYFAHTAGGRMIGNKMAKLLLDGKKLAFYEWDGDEKAMGAKVRENIDAMALDAWSDAQRDACIDETANTFKYSGSLLRYLSGDYGEDEA